MEDAESPAVPALAFRAPLGSARTSRSALALTHTVSHLGSLRGKPGARAALSQPSGASVSTARSRVLGPFPRRSCAVPRLRDLSSNLCKPPSGPHSPPTPPASRGTSYLRRRGPGDRRGEPRAAPAQGAGGTAGGAPGSGGRAARQPGTRRADPRRETGSEPSRCPRRQGRGRTAGRRRARGALASPGWPRRRRRTRGVGERGTCRGRRGVRGRESSLRAGTGPGHSPGWAWRGPGRDGAGVSARGEGEHPAKGRRTCWRGRARVLGEGSSTWPGGAGQGRVGWAGRGGAAFSPAAQAGPPANCGARTRHTLCA